MNPSHGVESNGKTSQYQMLGLRLLNPLHGVERISRVVRRVSNEGVVSPLHGVERGGLEIGG